MEAHLDGCKWKGKRNLALQRTRGRLSSKCRIGFFLFLLEKRREERAVRMKEEEEGRGLVWWWPEK